MTELDSSIRASSTPNTTCQESNVLQNTHLSLSLVTSLKIDYVSEYTKRWWKKESKSVVIHKLNNPQI